MISPRLRIRFRNCEIITCITGGIYPDRAAKQQTPVMGYYFCFTGGIYPDRAAKQQTPVTQVVISVSLSMFFAAS